MVAPETRYTTSGDVHLAYQVVGEGPLDIVFLSSWDMAIDFHWDDPRQVEFFEHLASFGRLILFDKRGTGASDSVSLDRMPTLESWVDDVRVVMDAVGSTRAAIVAWGYSGPLGVLFAAACPERTSALVLLDTFARTRAAPDYPEGQSGEQIAAAIAGIGEHWGTGDLLAGVYAPSLAGDEQAGRWWNRCQRLSISPAAAVAFTTMMLNTDVHEIVPSIQAPTLVLARRDGRMQHRGRDLASHLPTARHVELDGRDLLPWIGDSVAEEISAFLTGVRRMPSSDRVLATVTFLDLVRSTDRAAALGDRHWRQVLDQYDAVVGRMATAFKGHVVKNTGDGTLAVFDGPARAVRFATAMTDAVTELGLELRSGVHTGEIERRGEDVSGIAVHIAARIQAVASPGEVLVSRTVTDLVVGSGIDFEDRGAHTLKGVPAEWHLFIATQT